MPKRRGSYPRGKGARPSRGQRDAVEHWRLVGDVVGPRTWDVILKGKSTRRHRDRFRSTGLCHKLHTHERSASPEPAGTGPTATARMTARLHHLLTCPVTVAGTKCWGWDASPGLGPPKPLLFPLTIEVFQAVREMGLTWDSKCG